MQFLRDMKYKNKFMLLGGAFILVAFISIIGMVEIAKTTFLQKLERDHIEFVTLLDFKAQHYVELMEKSDNESRSEAYKILSATSDKNAKMGIYQLLDGLWQREESVFTSTNWMEKTAFRMLGFGRAFDLTRMGQEKVNSIKKLLNRMEDSPDSLDMYKDDMFSKINELAEASGEFGPIVCSAGSFVKNLMIALAVIFSIGTGLLLFFLARIMIAPVVEITEMARKVAMGNLTLKANVKGKDELGQLGEAFNAMINSNQEMIKGVVDNAKTLTTSSEQLSEISGQMTNGSESMSGRSDTVAAAAEEMSSNMNSVAAAIEEASTNVSLVASSAEEMTTVINEIAQNSEKGREITTEAVNQAKNASDRIDELGKAAIDIEKVSEVITEISDQTNLLALNATIEAARAGEAGKGFAVVANEIKELAKQTAEATGEIKTKIAGIQNSTKGTVTQIEEITKVIDDVNSIVSTIATAVEEQSVSTKEIADNVTQAAQGISEVTENVAQSSTVSGEIARDIGDVSQSANEMTNSSGQVNLNAGELKEQAGQLMEMVDKFKV